MQAELEGASELGYTSEREAAEEIMGAEWMWWISRGLGHHLSYSVHIDMCVSHREMVESKRALIYQAALHFCRLHKYSSVHCPTVALLQLRRECLWAKACYWAFSHVFTNVCFLLLGGWRSSIIIIWIVSWSWNTCSVCISFTAFRLSVLQIGAPDNLLKSVSRQIWKPEKKIAWLSK